MGWCLQPGIGHGTNCNLIMVHGRESSGRFVGGGDGSGKGEGSKTYVAWWSVKGDGIGELDVIFNWDGAEG